MNGGDLLCYGDLFRSVHQRVSAFKYYKEFYNRSLTGETIDDILDDAYSFLNKCADVDFLKYCAKKDGVEYTEYAKMLGYTC